MNDFLTKPIDPDKLFEMLHKWIKPMQIDTMQEMPCSIFPTQPETVSLPVIDGLDTALGLKSVLGDATMYLKMLQRYVDNQKQTPQKIQQAMQSECFADAERFAHSAKGVSANIGAVHLQSLAGTLEKYIRDKQDVAIIQRALEAFAQAHDLVIASLNVFLNQAPQMQAFATAPQSSVAQADLMTKLEYLLSDNNGEALELFEAHTQTFSQLFNADDYEKLKQYMGSFDFENALKLLTILKQ